MAGLAQLVVTIHVLLALATATAVVVLGIIALAAAIGASVSRTALDRLVLAAILAAAFAAASGLAVLGIGRVPGDPLHLLYGIAAIVVLPIARALVSRRTRRGSLPTAQGLGRWLLTGSLVTLGVLLRLAMTG